MSGAYTHKPVFLQEAITHLNVLPKGCYIDGTFGRGGHSKEILAALDAEGCLLALDKDPEAIDAAKLFNDSRFSIEQCSFEELHVIAEKKGISGKVDGILLDFGVSSPQIDNPERGFSFMRDGPLDMRMDPTQGLSAAAWLASENETVIADTLWLYGEERHSRRIAKAICRERDLAPITQTGQLAEIIAKAHPRWEKGQHAATRSFQAIRIHVNRELEAIQLVLPQAIEILAKGGRLVTITFHSLEDRLVKRTLRRFMEKAAGVKVKRITKAIKPSEAEVKENPRSRSATLRVIEKL